MMRLGLGFVAPALCVACGSDPVRPDAGGGQGGQPNARTCPEGPSYAEELAPLDIAAVSATVVDADGAPVPELLVFLCGTEQCSLPEHTRLDGSVVVGFSEPLEKPAFKYGDGLAYGRFAVLVPASSDTLELGRVGTPRLPDPGAPLVRGSVAESGGVRLALDADAVVEVFPIDYPNEEDRTFRAAELPLELAPPGLDGGQGIEVIFALAPVGSVVCPAAAIDLPNTRGYAPGAELDILVHGLDIEEEWAPYGGWSLVATGRVDDAGERIVTVSGGLPVLSAVGLRPR